MISEKNESVNDEEKEEFYDDYWKGIEEVWSVKEADIEDLFCELVV